MSSSFDPFDIRMQLLSHLKKLNASQQSIQKVVQFTIKYGARCGEDLWDCIIEECEKVSFVFRLGRWEGGGRRGGGSRRRAAALEQGTQSSSYVFEGSTSRLSYIETPS